MRTIKIADLKPGIMRAIAAAMVKEHGEYMAVLDGHKVRVVA